MSDEKTVVAPMQSIRALRMRCRCGSVLEVPTDLEFSWTVPPACPICREPFAGGHPKEIELSAKGLSDALAHDRNAGRCLELVIEPGNGSGKEDCP